MICICKYNWSQGKQLCAGAIAWWTSDIHVSELQFVVGLKKRSRAVGGRIMKIRITYVHASGSSSAAVESIHL
jgi:hypothetical protein